MPARVQVTGPQVGDAGVVVGGVVPAEERAAPGAGGREALEPLRVVRPVLQGLELALAVGVVVADARPTVALAHPQARQQLGEVTGDHRPAPIGMQRELIAGDALALEGASDQPFGRAGALPLRERPADHLAGEDVQDGVEEVHDALGGPAQLGDVPRPGFVRAGRHHDGHGVMPGMAVAAAAPVTAEAVIAQEAVHAADAADVGALVEEGHEHLVRAEVHEATAAQQIQHLVPLVAREGRRTRRPQGRRHGRCGKLDVPARRGSHVRRSRRGRGLGHCRRSVSAGLETARKLPTAPVPVRPPWRPERPTGTLDADDVGEVADEAIQRDRQFVSSLLRDSACKSAKA